jgi:hypothetical protein
MDRVEIPVLERPQRDVHPGDPTGVVARAIPVEVARDGVGDLPRGMPASEAVRRARDGDCPDAGFRREPRPARRVADLRAAARQRGVHPATMLLPGGVEVLLYEPKHDSPLDL